jgi:hypothetical protein
MQNSKTRVSNAQLDFLACTLLLANPIGVVNEKGRKKGDVDKITHFDLLGSNSGLINGTTPP